MTSPVPSARFFGHCLWVQVVGKIISNFMGTLRIFIVYRAHFHADKSNKHRQNAICSYKLVEGETEV